MNATPKALGYRFPAEWEKHEATWLSFPHKEASWPGKIESIYPSYLEFIAQISKGEKVHINVLNKAMLQRVQMQLAEKQVDMNQIFFHLYPTNDAWCRDYGPAFLVNPEAQQPKIIVDWGYNAWGGKYPPFDLDDQIPTLIANYLQVPVYYPNIIMEGGSVEFNGKGTLLTTRACLLNPNRNPHLTQAQIEQYLYDYYGVEQILWLNKGIIGDDTDGHIDDLTRFVNADTVVTVIEKNKQSENYAILQENLQLLKTMRLLNGKPLNIVELPMPEPVIYNDQLLPASYANFYIANYAVIVPTYQCQADEEAIQILEKCFPDRKVIGIDSTDMIWGLGSWHCLSQQEPAV
ncbi:MAG: agmatine deiminase family protein [Microscillaceae bacterium]|nr:agmatine deiminase family protein [Microscillaceae bacterium]MDW8460918.1 agmatine deiminase family protein [Cytophagales bacterium]